MNARVPGVDIPESLITEFDQVGDPEEISARIAARTIGDIRELCDGAHIMAIGWEEHIPGILSAAAA